MSYIDYPNILNKSKSHLARKNRREKRSKTGFKYNSIPILYDQGPFELLMKGKRKTFKYDKDFGIGLEVDEINE